MEQQKDMALELLLATIKRVDVPSQRYSAADVARSMVELYESIRIELGLEKHPKRPVDEQAQLALKLSVPAVKFMQGAVPGQDLDTMLSTEKNKVTIVYNNILKLLQTTT